MLIKAPVALLSLCLVCTSVNAQTNPQAIAGPGAGPCREYLEQRAQQSVPGQQAYLAWSQGFLSATNIMLVVIGKTDRAIPHPSSILTFLDKYCKQSPSSPFSDALLAFYKTL